ncbi:hypothetical protein C8F04DRAFT_1161148 [Mycena alexandri]|uniref:Uncharacterized protein n=1 Tax=Mycena alexandri TaxID=1745969 RepID=A0AAD6WM99_9AGAR|nr:hypothetical protein C8F04DRAFT_1161148 [Mycena alexandri]
MEWRLQRASPCSSSFRAFVTLRPPHASFALVARGTVLRARGKWNSDARRPSRPLHPRPPAPPPLVLLIHRRPRSSSHPLSPPYIPPHPNQARRVCSISAHVERAGCRYRVPNSRPTPSHAARAVPAPSRVPPPHTSRRCRVPIQPLWGFCLMRTKRSERGLESNVAQLIEVEYTELKT